MTTLCSQKTFGQPVRQDKEPAESLVVADNRQGQTGDAVTSESDHLL